jgi:hypothetical protein
MFIFGTELMLEALAAAAAADQQRCPQDDDRDDYDDGNGSRVHSGLLRRER